MVAITRDYVFTNPFQHSNSLNNHQQLLNNAVLELRNDRGALERAAEMKRLFLEQKECLCHGDLHTGSVMVLGEQAKVSIHAGAHDYNYSLNNIFRIINFIGGFSYEMNNVKN